jgi:hypothetical protein
VNAAVWGPIAIVVGGVLALLGTRYTARASKRAAEYTAAMQAPEAISSGYNRLNEDLWRSISALQTDLGQTRTELTQMKARVAALEAEADAQQRWRHASIAYIRSLLAYITTLLAYIQSTGGTPPASPPGVPTELAEDVRLEP